MKHWPLIVVFIAVAAWMAFSGRTPTGDEGLFSITDGQQFNDVLLQVRELSQEPILTFDAGGKLTADQVDHLKEGKNLIRKLIAFAPTNFAPYVMLAKTQRALGETEEATRNYLQALELIPKDSKDPDVVLTGAEVKYDLSTYYYERNEYEKAETLADEAIGTMPTNARYLSGAATIKSQLGKPNEARRLVDMALQYDPNDATARNLDIELRRLGY